MMDNNEVPSMMMSPSPSVSTPEDSPIASVSKTIKRSEHLSRVPQACEQCRGRKIKCNGKTPCDQCTSHSRTCLRAAGRKPRDKGLKDKRINQLESRIKQLETLITQTSEKEKQLSSQPALPANLSQISSFQGLQSLKSKSSLATPSPIVSSLRRPVDYTLIKSSEGQSQYLGSASVFSLASQLQDINLGGGNNPHLPAYKLDDNDIDCDKPFRPTAIPPKAICNVYVDAFFATVNKKFHFFEEEEFREKWEKTLNREIEETPPWSASYLAVLAHGAWYSQKDAAAKILKDAPGWRFCDSAIGLLDTLWKNPSVEGVRACLLIVLYLQAIAKVTFTYISLGFMIRMLQSLGAHREADSPVADHARRTFYICYIMDKTLTFTLGRPSGIQDFDCDVQRPLPREGEPVDIFVQQIELAHIAGIVHRRLFSAQGVVGIGKQEIPELLSIAGEILVMLEKWKSSLPYEYQVGKVERLPEMIIPCYLAYYHHIICVHRSHADIVTCPNHCVVEPARAMIRMIRDNAFNLNSGCWLGLMYVFAGTTVLYKHLLNHSDSPSQRESDKALLVFAQKAFFETRGLNSAGEYLGILVRCWIEALEKADSENGAQNQHTSPPLSSSQATSTAPVSTPNSSASDMPFSASLSPYSAFGASSAGAEDIDFNAGVLNSYTHHNPSQLQQDGNQMSLQQQGLNLQQPPHYMSVPQMNDQQQASNLFQQQQQTPFEIADFAMPAWLDMGQQMDWINWDSIG